MSGTSLDGVDAVLIRVGGTGPRCRFTRRAVVRRPFPPGLRKMLLRNSAPSTANLDEIVRLNVLLARLYADAVRALARSAGVRLEDIDLIGSHGQTIRHLPRPVPMFGRRVRATLQIGDPSVLAALTGIPVVGNFRPADMALGGQGAPLVPYLDWLVFRSRRRSRLLLNLGGIANLTLLPRACALEDVRAFDAGPANMLLDACMRRLFRRPFDAGGATARKGRPIPRLLGWLKTHPYLRLPPPKSTGRETFGDEFLDRVLRRAATSRPEDILATLTLFTAHCVQDACRRFVRPAPGEVIASGGGTRNRFLMDCLAAALGSPILTTDRLGLPSHAKEALCFAVLAWESMHGRAVNLPAVTGARRPAVLGVCAPPRCRR